MCLRATSAQLFTSQTSCEQMTLSTNGFFVLKHAVMQHSDCSDIIMTWTASADMKAKLLYDKNISLWHLCRGLVMLKKWIHLSKHMHYPWICTKLLEGVLFSLCFYIQGLIGLNAIILMVGETCSECPQDPKLTWTEGGKKNAGLNLKSRISNGYLNKVILLNVSVWDKGTELRATDKMQLD